MPTLTIDLPDNVNIPANWDAQAFVLEKMYEAGLVMPEQAAQTVEEPDEVDDDPDSWFTPEMRKKAKENRRRLEEEVRRNPPKRSKEEVLQMLINLPMPDEETIKRQDEVREHIKQWKLPW
jgi:hypothetical protein